MAKSLVIAEVYEGALRSASLVAVAAAIDAKAKFNASFDIAVPGSGVAAHAESLRGYGADKVLTLDNPALAHYTAEAQASAVASLVKAGGYTHVFIAATTMGKDYAPRVAGALDAGQASDITAIVNEKTFQRPLFAGSAVATVEITTPVKILTVRGTAYDAPASGAAASPVEAASTTVTASKEFVGFEAAVSTGRPEITAAKVVVAGGRGTKGDFAAIYGLADLLGAAVGASRAVCDAGWVPNDWQIGQTGKTCAPGLYFAVGISGAIQHWAGMKDSKVIVAINKDPEAPIHELADFGLVDDLFKAVPDLTEKLKALKASGQLRI